MYSSKTRYPIDFKKYFSCVKTGKSIYFKTLKNVFFFSDEEELERKDKKKKRSKGRGPSPHLPDNDKKQRGLSVIERHLTGKLES